MTEGKAQRHTQGGEQQPFQQQAKHQLSPRRAQGAQHGEIEATRFQRAVQRSKNTESGGEQQNAGEGAQAIQTEPDQIQQARKLEGR